MEYCMTDYDYSILEHYGYEQYQKVANDLIAYMSECEIKDLNEYYFPHIPQRVYLKSCIARSYQYFECHYEFNEDMRLVGGLYSGKSNIDYVWHAWVEFIDNDREIVFDGVLQRFYDKHKYYGKFQCIPINEYHEDALEEFEYEEIAEEIETKCNKVKHEMALNGYYDKPIEEIREYALTKV
ncbi:MULTISPECIES: hypothetical protein [Brevibacillus]|uniref:hypothetical protein n=1 Tax=Brevibacillus TaxID=55080 RepID=UPI002E20B872|nr:hypothetical protein [Brevibacillus centrosporus]